MDELYHFGFQKQDHKYIDRFLKNGKWQYVYKDAKTGAEQIGKAAEKTVSSAGRSAKTAVTTIKKSAPKVANSASKEVKKTASAVHGKSQKS